MAYETGMGKSTMPACWATGLLFVISVFGMIEGSMGSNIYLERDCGETHTVYFADHYTVYLDGSLAPLASCSVTFKSWSSSDLAYQVRSLDFQSIDTVLTITTKSSLYGYTTTKGRYSFIYSPSSAETTADKYLKFTVTRFIGTDYSGTIDVWIKDEPFTLHSWVIGIIVSSCVAFVVILVLVILCICKKKAGARGRVMSRGGAPQIGLHVTTTTTTIGQYGQTTQYAYPAPPPSYQQVYHGVAAPPPQYNTLPPYQGTAQPPYPAQPAAINQTFSSTPSGSAYPPPAPPPPAPPMSTDITQTYPPSAPPMSTEKF